MKTTATIPVRIEPRAYKLLRKDAKDNGQSAAWLLSRIVEWHYERQNSTLERSELKTGPAAAQAEELGKA